MWGGNALASQERWAPGGRVSKQVAASHPHHLSIPHDGQLQHTFHGGGKRDSGDPQKG